MSAAAPWLLVELTLAFIVFCADSVGEERRPRATRLVRALLWMVTLTTWFTHRSVVKLGRFAAAVWFLLTTGWLLSLAYDRIPMSTPVFLVVVEVLMGFVVYCVDALSSDLENKPGRRLLRSIFWVLPITSYLSDEDSVALVTASVTVWVMLTTGWLLGLLADRLTGPLGGWA